MKQLLWVVLGGAALVALLKINLAKKVIYKIMGVGYDNGLIIKVGVINPVSTKAIVNDANGVIIEDKNVLCKFELVNKNTVIQGNATTILNLKIVQLVQISDQYKLIDILMKVKSLKLQAKFTVDNIPVTVNETLA